MLLRTLSPDAAVILAPGTHHGCAGRDFVAGELIETVPVIPCWPGYETVCSARGFVGASTLIDWQGAHGATRATMLGAVGRYSIGEKPSVELIADVESRSVHVYARCDIIAGEPLVRRQQMSSAISQAGSSTALELPGAVEPNPVVIGDSTWGKGGFAARDIAVGEVVEEAALVIAHGRSQIQACNAADWNRYYFGYGGYRRDGRGRARMGRRFTPSEGPVAMCLGYGGVYNHSYEPNIVGVKDYAQNLMRFEALVDIAAGDELLQDYGWAPDDFRFFV